MAEAQFDFGLATRLDVDALGEPGRRTFRLLIRSGTSAALLWIEKQQLVALGLALEQVLSQVAPQELQREMLSLPSGLVTDFPLNPQLEFRVGQLQLGHDPVNMQFQIIAGDSVGEEEEDRPPRLTVRLGYAMASRLSQQIAAVAAAGRPRCPLCGEPLGDEPHQCALSNGHVH
ncbi:MAG: DUF3090 domain-containing protein [Chloroflexi bacterium]|nr:DUF3090 domain-containing protein [Chloroflexota bacterium]